MGELGLVHRHELSGTLHGLMRVRAFTQDDAHIFMLPEQIEEEIAAVVRLVDKFYRLFGFSYHVELSTRPEKALGSEDLGQGHKNSGGYFAKAGSRLQSQRRRRRFPVRK